MNKLFTFLGSTILWLVFANNLSAQETLVVDGSKGYDGVLVQGGSYILPGTDETWYAMPEFFTHNEGNTWTFNAYPYAEYAYFFELDEAHKFINVRYRQVDDPAATWANWELNRAVYVNGGDIGFPTWQSNKLDWDSANGWAGYNSVAVAQIAEGKYRLTLVVGEQLNGSNVSFKFYGQIPFEEGLFWPTRQNGIVDMEENPWLWLHGSNPEDTGNGGDIWLKDGAELADGDTVIVKLDMTTIPGKMTVEYHEQAVLGVPTFNGVEMVKHGNNWAYEGTLLQGDLFTLGNLEVTEADAASLYVDPTVATKEGDTYRFNAVSGEYTAVLYPALNYLKIFGASYAAPATYEADKALWIIGANIGQPTAEANNSNWGAALSNSIPVPQLSDNVYTITLTVGQEITSDINFKLFGQYGWGLEFTHDHLIMQDNDILYLNAPESFIGYDDNGELEIQRGSDDGNIFARSLLGNGDKLTLTIDMTSYQPPYIDEATFEIITHPGIITVDYQPYSGPVPTLNGENMASVGENFYRNVSLNKGDVITITDPEGFDFDGAYTDPCFLTNQHDGKFRLNAVDGDYAIVIDKANNYLRVIPGSLEQPANITQGGLWIIGEGFGRPSVANNAPGWSTGVLKAIPVAQTEPDIFTMIITCGQEMWDNWCNFKFFGQPDWGIEFKSLDNNDGYALSPDNPYLGVGNGEDGYDNGNIHFFGGDNGVFVNDEKYTITLDFTAGYDAGVLRVQQQNQGAATDITHLPLTSHLSPLTPHPIYNLQGSRVDKPQKGVYIQNHRKVVRK